METNLTEIIKKIRTAVLGREVRSSIADGLEYCGQISENAKADMDATAEAAKEAIDKTAEDAKNAIESNAASVKEQLSKDIDAKAAAALESIPEEYTELDGSVKQLKEDLGKRLFFPDTRVVRPDNYETILPDTKQAAINSIYNIIYLPESMSSMDMPSDLIGKQYECALITYGDITKTGHNQVLIVTNLNKTYTRTNDSTIIKEWVSPNSGITYIVNNGDNLLKVLEEATAGMNNTVIVNEGVYDFIAEALKLFGKDFIKNYTISTPFRGAILKNNVTVKCSRGAIIKAEYTGTNNAFRQRFSPLNSGEYGFTLINATVISDNVKYTFHDERSSYTDTYFINFINCNFKHTKAEDVQAIGGGLGKHGNVIIDGCTFESTGASPKQGIVSYHNSSVAGAISNIIIKNCVFKTGTVRISHHGDSTLITEAKVTNNVLKGEPYVTQENSSYNNVNMSLTAWNNVIE